MKRLAIFLAWLFSASCADGGAYSQAVCALVDTSGTYADQRSEVLKIVKQGMLPTLLPGDTLILARIDSDSYAKENVEAMVTLDHRPSHANAQKLAFARELDELQGRKTRARHTDISGALMLCSEYLAETEAGTRTIVVFSDMKEELPRGSKRVLGTKELASTRVVAMNVKRLRADTSDPQRYRARLQTWGERLTKRGAVDWRVIHDPEKLLAYLDTDR
jgi:hypothetical protein